MPCSRDQNYTSALLLKFVTILTHLDQEASCKRIDEGRIHGGLRADWWKCANIDTAIGLVIKSFAP